MLKLPGQVADDETLAEGQRIMDINEDQDREEVSQELFADQDAEESISETKCRDYTFDEFDCIFWCDPNALR